jgi:hypothetical protein
MDTQQVFRTLAENLLAPIPMCFALGIFCKMIHGGVKIPKELYTTISIFLLMSIGFMGGIELAHECTVPGSGGKPTIDISEGIGTIWKPALATLFLGCITPFSSYLALRKLGRFSIADAAGISAHYASTSAVTFAVAQNFVQNQTIDGAKLASNGYLPALVTILECPGIAISLAMGAAFMASQRAAAKAASATPHDGEGEGSLWEALYEVMTGQSIMLMAGLMVIGFVASLVVVADPGKIAPFKDFFYSKGMLFRGALCVFMLEMGLVAGERLKDLPKVGAFLVGFGILMPLVHGFLGAYLGYLAGMNLGGVTVLAAIVSSASYIAAPPAVRLTLPEANPTYSITAALAITFPFNIAIGIPIYYEIAKWLGPVAETVAQASGH